MSDFLMSVVAPFLVLCLLLGGIAEAYKRYQCGFYAEQTGRLTKWHALDACYIQTADGWQHWDEYKFRAIASEGLSK